MNENTNTQPTASASSLRAPAGWTFNQRKDGSIVIEKSGFGSAVSSPDYFLNVAAEILHELALDLISAQPPAASAEPVAWAHFAKNGNIRIWTSATKEAVRIAKENGIDLMPLYSAPRPDRVAELTAEVERLHAEIDRIRSKVFSATICHPRGVQPLLEEALAGAVPSPMTAAARDVLSERARQIKVGYSDIDDQQINDELAAMACFYAMPPGARDWPAEETGYGATFGAAIVPDGWFPETGDRRRELVKAGSMVLAEIERLDRAARKEAQS